MQSGEKNAQPWLGKMQAKWGLETTRQVLLVLAVFSLSGSTVVWLRKGLFYLLGYDEMTPMWLKTITYFIHIPNLPESFVDVWLSVRTVFFLLGKGKENVQVGSEKVWQINFWIVLPGNFKTLYFNKLNIYRSIGTMFPVLLILFIPL